MLIAECADFNVTEPPNRVKITCQHEGTNTEQHVLSGKVETANGRVIRINWAMPVYDQTARSAVEDAFKIVQQEIAHHAQWEKQDANPLIECADCLSMCLGSPSFQSTVIDILQWQW